jgi:hypothetical protein
MRNVGFTSQINKHPKKNAHLNCGFVLVKRKVAFLSEGAWSSGEYSKSALPLDYDYFIFFYQIIISMFKARMARDPSPLW